MIILISGKKQSGKDTIAKIIHYLIEKQNKKHNLSFKEYKKVYNTLTHDWKIKKFACKVKEIVSILTGVPINDLEKDTVKNSYLPKEWDRYVVELYGNSSKDYCDNKILYFSTYEEAINYTHGENRHIITKQRLTYRDLLQIIGTDLFRNQFNPSIWAISTLSEYKPKTLHFYKPIPDGMDKNRIYKCIKCEQEYLTTKQIHPFCEKCTNKRNKTMPDWMITDWRFFNEEMKCKEKEENVLTIRVDRFFNLIYPEYKEYINKNDLYNPNKKLKNENEKLHKILKHESEIELDNHNFNYRITNNKSLNDLIYKIEQILIDNKLLKI